MRGARAGEACQQCPRRKRRFSKFLERWPRTASDLPGKHAARLRKAVREKFVGNLAPGAGEGSLFAGHSHTKHKEVLSHILSKDRISSLLSPRAD